MALLLLALLCLLRSKTSASLEETGPPVGRAVKMGLFCLCSAVEVTCGVRFAPSKCLGA